jgi:hypothetical protein
MPATEAQIAANLRKAFRALEEVPKTTQIVLEEDPTHEELASYEPEVDSEDELAGTVAHSAPRTAPTSAQIPETIQFPARRSLDDAANFFGHQANGLC